MERSASLVSASTVRLAEAEASWEKRCKRERASLRPRESAESSTFTSISTGEKRFLKAESVTRPPKTGSPAISMRSELAARGGADPDGWLSGGRHDPLL